MKPTSGQLEMLKNKPVMRLYDAIQQAKVAVTLRRSTAVIQDIETGDTFEINKFTLADFAVEVEEPDRPVKLAIYR